MNKKIISLVLFLITAFVAHSQTLYVSIPRDTIKTTHIYETLTLLHVCDSLGLKSNDNYANIYYINYNRKKYQLYLGGLCNSSWVVINQGKEAKKEEIDIIIQKLRTKKIKKSRDQHSDFVYYL